MEQPVPLPLFISGKASGMRALRLSDTGFCGCYQWSRKVYCKNSVVFLLCLRWALTLTIKGGVSYNCRGKSGAYLSVRTDTGNSGHDA